MYLCMYYVCMHVKICLLCIDFFKLRQGASITRFAGKSVGKKFDKMSKIITDTVQMIEDTSLAPT